MQCTLYMVVTVEGVAGLQYAVCISYSIGHGQRNDNTFINGSGLGA